MKYPPLSENFIESFDYFSKRSGSELNRFREDLFLPEPEVRSERLIPKRRSVPFYLGILLIFFILLLRLISLQIVEGKRNLALSEGNRIRKERIKARRGLVLDEKGEVLARNLPTFSIILNPRLCLSTGCDLKFLAGLSGFSEIKSRFEKNKKTDAPITIASGLSRDEILKIGNIESLPYFQIEPDQIRSYPYGDLFSHVLGYLGEASPEDLSRRPDIFLGDRIGKEGVEKIYDRDLQGNPGWNLVEVDAEGKLKRFLSRKEPVNGKSIMLTLDKGLQDAALSALTEGAEKSGSCCGAVVVQNVRSGALLALVSLPSFDPNIFSVKTSDMSKYFLDKNLPFFNRSVSGNFSPGSVFKVVVAAAALSEKVVERGTLISAPGSISLGSFTFGDWKPGGHGVINIETAIAQSADTFFYQIGGGYEGLKGVGPEGIAKYAKLFGFGQRTLVDLPEEAEGLVPDPKWKKEIKGESWYVGNTYHFSIGQGDLLVTPLQLNQMTEAIANGGVLFRPYLLSKIFDERGETILAAKASVIRNDFVDSEVLRIVKEGMGKAAQGGGTAYPFFNFKFRVGAKTGTAEPGGEVKPHAWFTVFAPFEEPEVAVTVLVENGGQGADVAAPIARKILEKYFSGR